MLRRMTGRAHQNWKYRNGVTCGAKNSACTVNAKPAVSAQPRARSDSSCTFGSASTIVQPSSRQAVTSGKAQRARIAEVGQQRHRRRDRAPAAGTRARSSAAGRCRCSPPCRAASPSVGVQPGRRGTAPRRRRRRAASALRPADAGSAPARNWRVHDQEQPVQPAPQHEVPRRAVPQPAQQHRRHQVDIAPRLAAPVAAQRDIDVVAQETAQRDVPAAPELADVAPPGTGWRNSAGSARSACAPGRSPCRNSRRSRSRSAARRTPPRTTPRRRSAARRAPRRRSRRRRNRAKVSASTSFFARPSRKISHALGQMCPRAARRGRRPAVAA